MRSPDRDREADRRDGPAVGNRRFGERGREEEGADRTREDGAARAESQNEHRPQHTVAARRFGEDWPGARCHAAGTRAAHDVPVARSRALERMVETMTDDQWRAARRDATADGEDDVAEIRFSLTALGEAVVAERARRRFLGFGPCGATLPSAS